MATSEEYLASLGFDTSDVDKAVNQTVTLLGHLGAQFDQVEKRTSKAERALIGTAKATDTQSTALRNASTTQDRAAQSARALENAEDRLQAAINKVDYGQISRETDALASARERLRRAQAFVGETRSKLDSSEEADLAHNTNRSARATTELAAAQANYAREAAKANTQTREGTRGLLDQESALPRLRYALYDVAQVSLTASAAIAGVGVAVATASASYESAFTNVERTVEPGSIAVEELRSQLVGLSNEIPLTFQELSGIATLGNQLGVEARNIEGFTGTVARFAAVSGVSFEETAKSFGSMSEILGVAEADYERLGSAIALVGRRSVATESEILSLTREIGQQASQAGFSAEEVIGLSGALGELRVPPERARGALTTYFQTLTAAVAEGGDKLNDFATVVGMSSAELDAAVRSGQGLEVFQRFLASLEQTDTVGATEALDRLGLSQLRVSDVFQRLGANTDVFNQSIANGRQGWTEGSELARQYALVLDDLNTRWQLFLNALMTFAASVGDQVAPALSSLLDGASQVLQVLTAFVDSPAGEWAVRFGATILTLVAGYAALRGGIALATAALLALRSAAIGIGGAGIIANIRALAVALGLVKINADSGKVSLVGLAGSLKAVGRATIIIGILQLVTEALFNMKGAGDIVIDVLTGIAQSVVAAARILSDFVGALPGGGVFADWADGLQVAHDELGNFRRDAKKEWGNFARDMGWMSDETTEFGDAASMATPIVEDFAGGIGDLGDAAGGSGGAAEKIRTLVDYASDLSGVMTRAFDIRFGSTQALDQVTSSWNAIRQAVADTALEIAGYRAEMMQLTADRDIREYWLSVAENYGDALRAGQLRAEIADIDSDLSKKSASLTKAQEKNSRGLEGNSDSAIENRATLTGLVQGYQSYIEKLAASGASQEVLQSESQRLKQEFLAQAAQLGYNSVELSKYASAFDDVALAISRVPRNITVSANVNPAIQALNEFQARGVEAGQAVGNALSSAFGGGAGGFNTNAGEEAARKLGRRGVLLAEIAVLQAQALTYGLQGNVFEAVAARTGIAVRSAILASGSYRSGTAWTGSGNPDEIAGVVHNRERVLNERGSRMVSGQFVNAANQGRNPWQYAPKSGGGSTKFPSSMVVELSPVDRMILASGKPVQVSIAATDVVKSTGAANEDDNRRGGA
ncbi:MAG: hypothetical protein K0S70_114 [Microbacterium sp.]|jgi:TP901 family phage tail tape measure protein|nr:hypothetical protein [Microbacterium sp.]